MNWVPGELLEESFALCSAMVCACASAELKWLTKGCGTPAISVTWLGKYTF